MGAPTSIPSEWLTADNEVINPTAPAGSGGGGGFRNPRAPGDGSPINPVLPGAGAPGGRYLVPPDPEMLTDGPPPPQPPPVTKPSVTVRKQQQDPGNDIDVKIEVLPDVEDSNIKGEAETKPILDGLKPVFPAIFVDDATKKITKFTSKFILKGRFIIQIRYQPGTDTSARSAYGRGTTSKDVKAGNVTIGFHESCHLNDHLTWLKAHPLPVFTGKVGMTEAEFDAAAKAFGEALDQYIEDDDKNTEALTDEVGDPTRTEYLAGKRSGRQ